MPSQFKILFKKHFSYCSYFFFKSILLYKNWPRGGELLLQNVQYNRWLRLLTMPNLHWVGPWHFGIFAIFSC